MTSLEQDAISIWSSGVDAVLGETVIANALQWDGRWLSVGSHNFDLSNVRRILVVGAGKATASMADGLLQVFARYPELRPTLTGWINVPEGTFDTSRDRPIHFHVARPRGINEPTQEAFAGTMEIYKRVSECEPSDLVICLISGGGSALLPMPVKGISLEEKIEVTRLLSSSGANIEQLNIVRRSISQIKDGGLARACSANRIITLVLSDVLGDPLPLIASGPTWIESRVDPSESLAILHRFDPHEERVPHAVLRYLQARVADLEAGNGDSSDPLSLPKVSHVVVGNNATAVDRAAQRAEELGYRAVAWSSPCSEGDVATVAQKWIKDLSEEVASGLPICLITGGEPTVELPRHDVGKGGRNQQLVLLALLGWLQWMNGPDGDRFRKLRWLFLSGGTDGEDGPTDAAGAWCDGELVERMKELQIDPRPYLESANAYPFFEATKGLWKSGPTGTNVCDLRIAILRD